MKNKILIKVFALLSLTIIFLAIKINSPSSPQAFSVVHSPFPVSPKTTIIIPPSFSSSNLPAHVKQKKQFLLFRELMDRLDQEEAECRQQLNQVLNLTVTPMLVFNQKRDQFYQNESEALQKLEKLFEIQRPTETINQFEQFMIEHGKKIANESWFKGKTDHLSSCGAFERISFMSKLLQDAYQENWSPQTLKKISSLTVNYLYREFQHYDLFLYTTVHLFYLQSLLDLGLLHTRYFDDVTNVMNVLNELVSLTRHNLKEENYEDFNEADWKFIEELRTENQILRANAKELMRKIYQEFREFQTDTESISP